MVFLFLSLVTLNTWPWTYIIFVCRIQLRSVIVGHVVSYGRTYAAPYCCHGYDPLRCGGNVVMRIGTQQQLLFLTHLHISNINVYACLAAVVILRNDFIDLLSPLRTMNLVKGRYSGIFLRTCDGHFYIMFCIYLIVIPIMYKAVLGIGCDC